MKDKEIEKFIKAEEKRQKKVINLIASENYVSKDVLRALGSVFNNKYSEGYPKARYYGGNQHTDKVEELCKKRALKLFSLKEKSWGVNVQPLSGSPANISVYLALVPVGGKIMGLALDQGGHLSHGHKVSVTGKIWKQIPYGVSKETERIDYEDLKKIAKKEKPDIIVAGVTAYSRKLNYKKFREIADSCGAYLLADISHVAGLIVAGLHPSPFPYADVVTTTTHKTLRGPRSAIIFSKKELSKKIDRTIFPGVQGGPHMNQIAAVAVALKEADSKSFNKYISQVVKNAKVFTEELSRLGWRIVSGGTDTHLFLVDTWSRKISGKEAENLLEKASIIVNKNTIPFDERTPFDPSGIRIGTPAETTRGKKESDMIKIARRIDKILSGNKN